MGQEYEHGGFRGRTEYVHFFGKLALKTDLPGEFLWCQRSVCLGKRHRDAVFEMPHQQMLPISYRLLDQIGKTLDFSYCFWKGELYENHHPLGNKSKLDSFSMSLKFKMKICWFRNGDMGTFCSWISIMNGRWKSGAVCSHSSPLTKFFKIIFEPINAFWQEETVLGFFRVYL